MCLSGNQCPRLSLKTEKKLNRNCGQFDTRNFKNAVYGFPVCNRDTLRPTKANPS